MDVSIQANALTTFDRDIPEPWKGDPNVAQGETLGLHEHPIFQSWSHGVVSPHQCGLTTPWLTGEGWPL